MKQDPYQRKPGTPININIIKMDKRSLSEMLTSAATHYNRYQNSRTSGERFAYLNSMFILSEHVAAAREEYKQPGKREIADILISLLDVRKEIIEEYTRKHFRYIKRAVELLEQESAANSDIARYKKDIAGLQG
jgi:hypothetical protein